MVLTETPLPFSMPDTRTPAPGWFYSFTSFNERTQDAGQRTWGWRRVLQIINDWWGWRFGGAGDSWPLTGRQPWPFKTVKPLFKFKWDTTEKTSCNPSGPGLEARSLIKLGCREWTWNNGYPLASSAGAFIYTQRLALRIWWVSQWHLRADGETRSFHHSTTPIGTSFSSSIFEVTRKLRCVSFSS